MSSGANGEAFQVLGRDISGLGTAEVEIRRSTKRRRSVSARREGDRVIVLMPAHLSPEQEQEHVRSLVARLDARRRRSLPDDDELMRRAQHLSSVYLDGRASPESVRWVRNQNTRWASCSTQTGKIRLSHRLRGMPPWVVDAVIVHELAHLIEPGHGKRFQALMGRYPDGARARDFLAGVTWQAEQQCAAQ